MFADNLIKMTMNKYQNIKNTISLLYSFLQDRFFKRIDEIFQKGKNMFKTFSNFSSTNYLNYNKLF